MRQIDWTDKKEWLNLFSEIVNALLNGFVLSFFVFLTNVNLMEWHLALKSGLILFGLVFIKNIARFLGIDLNAEQNNIPSYKKGVVAINKFFKKIISQIGIF